MLLKAFQSFIHKNELITSQRPSLIALSGGIDSVVLCHLFAESNLPFALAHINFQLRGDASVKDASFCQDLANKYEVPFHLVSLDTVTYAKENGQSIQLAARDFRYKWLENIRKSKSYACIATAHHLNDSMETVIYNMTKGCGLKGLLGIPLKNGKVIRPLLFAARLEIEAYALDQKLNWREDASNSSLKYRRNQIRHQVIPPLREINSGFDHTIAANLRRWQESYQLYQHTVNQLKQEFFRNEGELIYIDAIGLVKYPEKTTLLYEWLSPYGFTEAIIQDLFAGEGSGRQFFSATHRLVTTTETYLIEPIEQKITKVIFIENDQKEVPLGDNQYLKLQYLEKAPEVFPKDNHIAYLSRSELAFPLKLRRWQSGDRFQPLGMSEQHQKLQDFFSNQKLSLVEKERVWIMESAGKICWVVGMRMDERFKVKDKAKKCLKISVVKL